MLILLTVLVNIIAGCYAAIRLGYGPPTVRDAVLLLVDPHWLNSLTDRFQNLLRNSVGDLIGQLRVLLPAKLPVEMVEPEEEPVVVAPSTKETVDDIIQQYAKASLDDLLEDESDELSRLAPMQELFDDDLASILMEKGTEAWLMNEKHVETSIMKLNVVMMKSGRFAADLDKRLRTIRGRATPNAVKHCLDDLRDDCRNYLEALAATTEQMLKRLDEFGDLKYLAEEIDYANMEQSAQIETTISNLDHLDVVSHPEEAVARLLRELASLRVARHRLHDMHEKATIKIVQHEDRLETIPQQLFFGETTGLRSRIGLDAAIFDWWKQKRHEKRQLTFCLLDFVDFGGLNDEHGILICDKIIRVFGKSLESAFDAQDLVGVYNGNCFMVATINIGPRKTITEIERIRQRCEKTIYRYSGGAGVVRSRLTCGITEALANQSAAELVKNLEMTLAAAKKVGRNLTFHYDAGHMNPQPEKIDAPNLGESEKEVNLDDD